MTAPPPPHRDAPERSRLEFLYHISRELASDLDLNTVLRRVLALSLESVEGTSGSIIVLDSKGSPVDSAIIHSGQVFDHTTQQLRSTLEEGLAGWVVENRVEAIVPDTSRDDRWTKRPDDAPDQTGPKSAMSTPLLARDELVGVMTLAHPTPGTFTGEHAALMRAIADQAGITILNARLYEESRRNARVMSALAESAVAITASLGLEDILQRVLEQVKLALNVESVALALVEAGQRKLITRAAAGAFADRALKMQVRMGEGIAGRVARSGEPVIVPDVSEEERFRDSVERGLGQGVHAVACAPIRAQGEIVGTLEAFNPIDGEFAPEALRVLEGIGALAGSVIRYAQLFERLEAAHQSYRDLFDDSIDIILITDWDGRIRQSNRRAREIFKLEAGRLHGRLIEEMHVLDRDKFENGFLSRLSTLETISYESQLSVEASELPVQVFVRQIHLEGEDKLQWILHDITERKSMDSLREELISMIYHDLRSPLANVLYSLDMLKSMLQKDDETLDALIDVATRATDRIQRLTSSLLDLQRLESGQPVTNRAAVPVAELFLDAEDAIKPLAVMKAQEFVRRVETEAVQVLVDRDMITRVLINLLENAVKYTPRRGRIETGARMQNGSVEIWVQDNGPGIPEDQRHVIFEKYSRLASGSQGFGLGLSFCRLAVEGHGGRIWVEEGESPGSRFIFSLPAFEEVRAVQG